MHSLANGCMEATQGSVSCPSIRQHADLQSLVDDPLILQSHSCHLLVYQEKIILRCQNCQNVAFSSSHYKLGFILCVWAAYENFLAGLLMVWGELSFLQHNKNRKTCQCRRLMLFSAKNCLEWCAWDVMFGTRTRISQENKVNWKIMLPHNLIYVFKLLQKPSSL